MSKNKVDARDFTFCVSFGPLCSRSMSPGTLDPSGDMEPSNRSNSLDSRTSSATQEVYRLSPLGPRRARKK